MPTSKEKRRRCHCVHHASEIVAGTKGMSGIGMNASKPEREKAGDRASPVAAKDRVIVMTETEVEKRHDRSRPFLSQCRS